eukprot:gene18777-20668_t
MAEKLGLVKVKVPLHQLEDTLFRLTVPELQQELRKRGLKRSGLKAKLVERLKEAIENEQKHNESLQESANISGMSTEDEQSFVEDKGDSSAISVNQVEHQHLEEENLNNRNVSSAQEMVPQGYHEGMSTGYSENFDQPIAPQFVEGGEVDVPDANNVKRYAQQEEAFVLPEEPCAQQEETHANKEEACAQQEETYAQQEEIYAQQEETYAQQEETYAQQEEAHLQQEEAHVQSEEAYTQPIEPHVQQDETYAQPEETPVQQDEAVVQQGEEFAREDEIEENVDAPQIVQEDQEEQETIDEDNKDQSMIKEQENEEQIHTEDDQHSDVAAVEDSLHEEEEDAHAKFVESKQETQEALEIQVSYNDKVDIDDGEEEQTEKDDKKIVEKKLTTPVQIKKRKLTTDSDSSKEKSETATPRKRRWGSSTNKESLIISSDSLKALIPDVSIVPPSCDYRLGLGLDYAEFEEGEIDETPHADHANIKVGDDDNDDEDEVMADASSKKEIKRGRIVRMNTNGTVRLMKQPDEIADDNQADASQKTARMPEPSKDEPHDTKERSQSPAKNNPSNILTIFNLVRPFTLRQLRELLSKTGTVLEEGFWINKIKSHCYVTYDTVEEAITSRQALHRSQWPSGSPKLLSVDFADNEVMFKETDGKLGTPPSPARTDDEKPEERRRQQKDDDIERGAERHGNERERQEEHRRKDQRHQDDKEEGRAKQKEKKEPAPSKVLDDLFLKTKTMPWIYWLPLTKEQIAVKEKEREARREERLKAREKEVAAENVERENRRKQREIEMQRHRERRSSPPSQQQQQHSMTSSSQRVRRKSGASPPLAKEMRRSPELPRRGIRNFSAQYRRRSPSSSSAS